MRLIGVGDSGQKAFLRMRTFLINLARRPDRLRAMLAQLSNLSPSGPNRSRHRCHQNFRRPCRQALCSQRSPGSHSQRATSAAPSATCAPGRCSCPGGDNRALILEDDVALDPGAYELLHDLSWIQPSVGLVKIEHYGPESQRVLVDELTRRRLWPPDRAPAFASHRRGGLYPRRARRRRSCSHGRSAGRCRSITCCSTRTTRRWRQPCSPISSRRPSRGRARPSAATPTSTSGAREMRGGGWRYVRREIVRAYYELRLLPSQIGEPAAGASPSWCAWKRPASSRPAVNQPPRKPIPAGRVCSIIGQKAAATERTMRAVLAAMAIALSLSGCDINTGTPAAKVELQLRDTGRSARRNPRTCAAARPMRRRPYTIVIVRASPRYGALERPCLLLAPRIR